MISNANKGVKSFIREYEEKYGQYNIKFAYDFGADNVQAFLKGKPIAVINKIRIDDNDRFALSRFKKRIESAIR